MKALLLLAIFISMLACKRSRETTQTKMSPPLSMLERSWWFDVALDEEKFNPNHDEERSPAPPREKGERVKVAVHVALNLKEQGGMIKIKYMNEPTDCELVTLKKVDFYENGDIEATFRAKGKYKRELRGIFSEDSNAPVAAPYHKKLFLHLKIMQSHSDDLVSLFSMNDNESFNLKPEDVQEKYFNEDDSKHCKKAL